MTTGHPSMTVRCPVCKAASNPATTCRRCKADLALVFADRQHQRTLAVAALVRRDFDRALQYYLRGRDA